MKIESAKEIWGAALGELEVQVNKANFDTWLRDTQGLSFQSNLFVVGVPSVFVAECLEKRFYSLVQKTLVNIIGREVNVQFQVCPSKEDMPYLLPSPELNTLPTSNIWKEASPARLNRKYTFDTFITGSCNRLAYALAWAASENPSETYNPLFFYGGTGLGKTHLLHAIGNASLPKGLRLLYVTSEQFTNEFISALRQKRIDDFHSKYRSLNILLIDDIHFISGKEQTQESFFHIFNDLYNHDCQIVITSDRHPKSITLLQERLRSRFEWGTIADLQPPDYETRVAILLSKTEQMGVSLDKNIIARVAQLIEGNIRELEGALNQIVAYVKLTRVPPTPELANQILNKKAIKDTKEAGITPELVLKVVAEHFGFSPETLCKGKQGRKASIAQQIAMYLLREEVGYSFTRIAQLLGFKSSSTILHGYRKIVQEAKLNSETSQRTSEIQKTLKASTS